MLILTRKEGELTDIFVHGVRIEIEVIGIRGNQVKIGFRAPEKTVTIHRREITLRIEEGKTKDPHTLMSAIQNAFRKCIEIFK